MRWTRQGKSADIDDRRGMRGGLRGGAAPLGIGGLVLLAILSVATGQDFLSFFDTGSGPASETAGPVESSAEEEEMVEFVSFVLDDSQATWQQILGARYERAQLVLFRDAVQSACGQGDAATGPFYCPGDHKVYIDLGFFNELKDRFGAAGDFAQAYVLAHEIGHHVQTLLGTESRMRRMQQANPRRGNELSVQLELQADCYAGIWGNSTAQRQILEHGDVEEGLNAAGAIGDDRLQRMAGGRVAPERFTHGSSAQRVEWFRRGLQSGNIDSCDTFTAGR
jgi:predicted metalloprotease